MGFSTVNSEEEIKYVVPGCVGPSLRVLRVSPGFHGEGGGIVLNRYLALTVMLLVAASLFAQVIPHTEAETLSGKKIVLPEAAAGHPAVFIVGFSRAGGDSSGRWDKQLRQDFATESNVRVYSVAELQDAPKMVRGMIRHGMRGSIPKNEQDSFVLLYQDEDVWKKLADFSDPNDAYILLVDSADNIRWRTHGKGPNQQAVNALRDEISKATSSKP
jgi:hypothetical protein